MTRASTVALALLLVTLTAPAVAQQTASREVEVFGQKIHYLEAGSGPAVILLHGLGGDATNWAPTVPALAPQFHVYVPDQIGFGQSDKPYLNYRVSTLVDFLEGFYKKLGIARATLVGNSLGGWTALAFALAHPDQVERLVLVDAAGYSPARWGGPPLTRQRLLGLNPATLEGMKQILSTIFYNKQMVTDQFAEQAFAQKMRSNNGYTVNQFVESILQGEDLLDGKLGAVKAPTLVVWGREDQLTPLAIGEAFAQDIAGAQKAILDHCGHVPQIECAVPFNAALLKFLSAPAQGAREGQ